MKTTRKRFRVRGPGRLPVDMLRYDCAWPATGSDAALIEALNDPLTDKEGRDQMRTMVRELGIVLESDSVQAPCVERWESFCWHAEVVR